MSFEVLEYDLLVVGNDLGAYIAALTAADHGLKVAFLEGDHVEDLAVSRASVIVGGCLPEEFEEDLNISGSFLNNKKAVEKLSQNTPAKLQKWFCDRLGIEVQIVSMQSEKSGMKDVWRIPYSPTELFHRISASLKEHSCIEVFQGNLIDLILSHRDSVDPQRIYDRPKVHGAYVLLRDTRTLAIAAKATVLASAGASAFYPRSARKAAPSALAAATRAGARMMHMEYQYFHPLVFRSKSKFCMPLPLGLLNAGACFREEGGMHLFESRDPSGIKIQELWEWKSKNSTQLLFLDIRGIGKIEKRFPHFLEEIQELYPEWKGDVIPVEIAAEFTIGGIWTDTAAKTSIEGLYACGECACNGVHGAGYANHSALAESLVYGEIAGEAAANFVNGGSHSKFRVRAIEVDAQGAGQGFEELALVLAKIFEEQLGPSKDLEKLKEARRLVRETKGAFLWRGYKIDRGVLDLRDQLDILELCLAASIENPKSMGCHTFRQREIQVPIDKSSMLLDTYIRDLNL